MSYKTLAVELENGVVYPTGSETLPSKAQALLTILAAAPAESSGTPDRSLGEAAQELNGSGATNTLEPASVAKTGAELAALWPNLLKLPPDEARAFADDIEDSRANLPPLKSAWD